MDTVWFRHHLEARKMSQRALAKVLGVDHAAVSLMLRGKRKMTNAEAKKIADVIGAKVTEVLRRAGIDVRDDVLKVPITSYINGDGNITLFPDKTHDHAVGPADCPHGTYAVQCRAPTQPQDGWLMFVSPAQTLPDALLDRLCFVATTKGSSTLAIVRRGYRSGTFNLIVWPSRDVRTDASVAWCSPVLWIKP